MQFKVPQFLEIEDKLFGPLTFRQFIYLAGGAGICFVFYKLLGIIWGLIPIFLFGGFSLLLAFYRPNNKPFIEMVGAAFVFLTKSKLYIWKRRTVPVKNPQEKQNPGEELNKLVTESISNQKLSRDKLKDLAWSLDVLDLDKDKK